ncbi:polysaccharide pyruvyl transferase family protein [Thermococcus sibiricus]|uniref:Polysaccharide pyruvyl transferase domain-containing protein n=1 Tax=Thermococcus sibiricus TaxID=172049 RepID=A0A101EJX7_9EURY|nr:polysaccharide pyruvyl transferase family protein [Thermococcus sibiricus]KUK16754.1 MAG: hypothetical protein XD54_1956 [Thermococcus sibiricus]
MNDNTRDILQLTLLGRHYNFNLGGNLQAFALYYTLKTLNGNCSVIDYLPNYLHDFSTTVKNILKNRGLLYLFRTGVNFGLNNIKGFFWHERKRRKMFVHFRKNIQFSEKTFFRFKELEERFSNSEDIFIVGSDLVWLPQSSLEVLRVYLLSFVKNGLKASYAASVGRPIPHSLKPIYAENLKEFDFISVREESSRKYLQEILPNLEIEVVLDPTALLSRDEWLEVAKKPSETPQRPYILVYDLYRSEEILPPTLRFAKKNQLNVITFSYSLIRKITHPKISSFYFSGPSEFLWLLSNAEVVVTSSFHGAVLATIFQKPFVAINPEPFAPASRILDFLNLVGCEDRFLDHPKDIEEISMEIDWKTINRNLEKQKRHSMDYLKKVVNG